MDKNWGTDIDMEHQTNSAAIINFMWKPKGRLIGNSLLDAERIYSSNTSRNLLPETHKRQTKFAISIILAKRVDSIHQYYSETGFFAVPLRILVCIYRGKVLHGARYYF